MKRILFIIALLVCAAIPSPGQGDGSSMKGPNTKAPTSAKRAPVFRPTKNQITSVQKILKDKNLYSGEATGTYNDATRSGIKSFQKDNGLKETGTLNRATLEKFGVELTESQKAIPVSPNSFATPAADKTTSKSSSKSTNKTIFRATADQIKAAQKLMRSNSLYAGDETGKLDDATRAGLKKYQQANGLNVTGTLNQVTLDKMGIALTDKQKADAAQTNK